MNILLDVDWRNGSTNRVVRAIENELKEIAREIQRTDAEWQLEVLTETGESLLGIAFVMAQTYISGTVSDIQRASKCGANIQKHILISRFSPHVAGSDITYIQLCYDVANYFKHHDEWDIDWKPNRKNKSTIFRLAQVGITKDTSYPCHQAAQLLWGEEAIISLENLLEILRNWRQKIVSAVKENQPLDK